MSADKKEKRKNNEFTGIDDKNEWI